MSLKENDVFFEREKEINEGAYDTEVECEKCGEECNGRIKTPILCPSCSTK